MRRRAGVLAPALLICLSVLLGLVYHPHETASAAPAPAAVTAEQAAADHQASALDHQQADPVFIANHAQAAAPSDHSGGPPALPPSSADPLLPPGRAPPPAIPVPVASGVPLSGPSARAPPVSQGS